MEKGQEEGERQGQGQGQGPEQGYEQGHEQGQEQGQGQGICSQQDEHGTQRLVLSCDQLSLLEAPSYSSIGS